VNVMDQYRPEWKACLQDDAFELCRRITKKEYEDTIMMARQAGLTRGIGLEGR